MLNTDCRGQRQEHSFQNTVFDADLSLAVDWQNRADRQRQRMLLKLSLVADLLAIFLQRFSLAGGKAGFALSVDLL